MTQPALDKSRASEDNLQVAPGGPPKKKLPLKQILKILVSLGLLAFVLHKAGFESTIHRLSQANLWYIPLCMLIYLFAQAVSTYRWKFLAAAMGFYRSFRELYDYYLIGMFSNQFLPGAIGGDALRMFYLAKSCGRKKREALMTLLAERGVGLVALLLMTTAIVVTPAADIVPWPYRLSLMGLSLTGLVGFLVLRLSPTERWVERFPKLELILQAQVYWDNLPLLAKSIGMSLFVHIIMVLMHAVIAAAMHVSVPVLYLAVVYGIVSLVSVLPITQGGLGVREVAYQTLLMKVGLTPETGLAFGVYWFLISTCTSLLGGIVLMKGHYKTPSSQEDEAA